MPIIQVTPAAEAPITLAEARLQCAIDADITDEDALIESLIDAATDYCEQYTGRPLITQEKQYVGMFTPKVELSANLLTVEAISYRDESGAAQSIPESEYFVDIASLVGSVTSFNSWPSTQPKHPQPVSISFTCGYGSAADVPEAIKQCIRMLVGHWFNNRDAVVVGSISSEIEFSAHALLNPYRVPVL